MSTYEIAGRRSLIAAVLFLILGSATAFAQTADHLGKFTNPTTLVDSRVFDNGWNVGIGTTNPQDFLHLYRSDPPRSTVGVLMGNSTTGPGRRGFLVDYHLTGGAELWNFENTSMWFGTNNSRRMTITNDGRVRLTGTFDANGSPGSGVFEIGNALRLDRNEIITNTNSILLLNHDNNGDVRMDGGTFHLDASSNRLGIGISIPRDKLHLFDASASTVGILMGNGLVGTGRRGFLVDFHSSGGAELWNFENTSMWFGTNNRRRMTIGADGRVGIGGLPTSINFNGRLFRPLLDVHGTMRLADVPVWDGPNRHDLTWGAGFADGVAFNPDKLLISREGSSRRYKKNIQSCAEDFSKILDVEPKQYQMKDGYGLPDVWTFGYIAEELDEAGLGSLVIYDKEGNPDGVAYKKVALYTNEVVKDQQLAITRLEQEVADLKKLVRELARSKQE